MRPETLEIFTVSKVSGRNFFSAYARARISGNSRNLQGFGTQNFPGGLATVKYRGEPQRGTTKGNHNKEPPWRTEKKNQTKKRAKKKFTSY